MVSGKVFGGCLTRSWRCTCAGTMDTLKAHLNSFDGVNCLLSGSTLICFLGPHYQLIDPASGNAWDSPSFVAGLDDTYSLVDSRIPGAAIQVDFSPLGGRRLLQLPMHLVKTDHRPE